MIRCLAVAGWVVVGWFGAVALAKEPPAADAIDVPKRMAEAQQALESKAWDDAVRHARAVLREVSDHVPAYVILGKAYAGNDALEKQLDAYREGTALLRRAVPLDKEQRHDWDEMIGILKAKSSSDAAIIASAKKHADKLVSLSSKSLKKDPYGAERAALAALALDPTHEPAAAALTAAQAGLVGNAKQLISTSMAAWTWLTKKNWYASGKSFIGDVPDGALSIRTNRKWPIVADIVIEARLLDPYEDKGPTELGIVAPYPSDEQLLCFSLLADKLEIYEKTSKRRALTHVSKRITSLDPPVDPKAWNVYQFRLRKNEVIALVNDVEVGRCSRPKHLVEEGYLGLKVQYGKFEFRSIKVVRK